MDVIKLMFIFGVIHNIIHLFMTNLQKVYFCLGVNEKPFSYVNSNS